MVSTPAWLGGLIALIHRAAARPAQVRDTVLRVAVDTGAFSNPTTSGIQEGYHPLPSESEQLFVSSGFQVEDMLSLKSIANDRAHQLARLDPGVKDAVERLARAVSPARDHRHLRTCAAGGSAEKHPMPFMVS